MELWSGIKDTASFAWRAGRLNFILGFSLMMVEPLAMPIAAVGLRGIVDNAIAGEARTAVIWAVVVAVLATLALTAGHFAHIFYFKTAEDMSALIERDIAELSNGSVGLEHHERADYADRIAYIRREADRAAWGTVSTLYGGVAIVVALVVTGALLATLSPWLLLLPVAAIPPLILGRKAEVVAKAGRAAGAPATRQANHLFGLLADAGPVKEVRTSGLEEEVRRRQQTAWDEATRLELRAEYKAAWIRAGGQIFFAVAYVGATLLVLRDAVRGHATVGDVLMVITLAAQVNNQVTAAVTMLQGLQRTSSMFTGDPLGAWRCRGVSRAPFPTPRYRPTLTSGIELHDVTFTYPGTDKPVLEHVDLTIPAGSTVAIVGENGAGKSTLIKLLCRFYDPDSGVITVDGTDLARMPVTAWRERISAGFQDFARFEFSAQQTVGLGDLPQHRRSGGRGRRARPGARRRRAAPAQRRARDHAWQDERWRHGPERRPVAEARARPSHDAGVSAAAAARRAYLRPRRAGRAQPVRAVRARGAPRGADHRRDHRARLAPILDRAHGGHHPRGGRWPHRGVRHPRRARRERRALLRAVRAAGGAVPA